MIVVLAIVIASSIKNNSNANDLCNKIQKYKEDKANFILVIDKKASLDFKETIDRFSKEYKEIKFLRPSYSNIKASCFKKEIEETGLYNDLKQNEESGLMFYKSGIYQNSIFGGISYNSLEDLITENKLAKKHDIKETITLEKLKDKIKDEYILIVLLREENRKIINPYVKKHFKDYEYDIVNYRSTEGKKIYDYVKDNYEISNRFPQAMYFKNHKLLVKETIYTLDSRYERFLNAIKEANK